MFFQLFGHHHHWPEHEQENVEHKDFHYSMWKKLGLMVGLMVTNILRTSQIIIIIAAHFRGLAFTMSIIATKFGGDRLLSWAYRHKFCIFFLDSRKDGGQ
jgi:hypothetical protein